MFIKIAGVPKWLVPKYIWHWDKCLLSLKKIFLSFLDLLKNERKDCEEARKRMPRTP